MIKAIKKPKRTQTKKYWRNKADKKLQEIGRMMYEDKGCLICGGEYSCLHHYIPKSRSTHLRYKWINLIPICAKHHCSLHSGDSRVQARIDIIKGQEWLEDLLKEERAGIGISAGYTYFKNIYESLSKIEPLKLKL